MKKIAKYRNKKTNGFASKKEARRAAELELLQRAGKIFRLRFQVPYELLPAQPDENGKIDKRTALRYIADAVFEENGEIVVLDVKGFRTAEYKIKKKLMQWFHGIRIREE